MKQCPQCSNSCEDLDIVCRGCGYLFSAQGSAPQSQNVNQQPGGYPNDPSQNFSQPSGYSGQPNYGPAPVYQSPMPQKKNGLAIASLVLGIVGVVFDCCYGIGIIPSIVGLILGVVSRNQIQKTGASGKNQALAGLILSGIGIAFGIACIIYYVYIITSNSQVFWDTYNSAMSQYSK